MRPFCEAHASADRTVGFGIAADVEITGKSGHGAHPHLARDPIVAAASLVSALQTVISREVAPLSAAVLTIGSIHGGSARNSAPARSMLCHQRFQSRRLWLARKRRLICRL